ncbi:CDP-diacylglycerol diphosphatase, partial [Klebsiella pneumoniae]|nr:CDP-diacylglycerol diphosphatase [Klebsiella pneumoniae]
MKMRIVRYFLLSLLVAILAALAGGYYWLHSGNPDA